MAFEPTPLPSIIELATLDSLVNGDIGAAQDEIVWRLRAQLNAVISAKNVARGWTGNLAVEPIANPAQSIEMAPRVLSDRYIGKILVGVSVETSAEGSGAFKNVATVTVSSIEASIKTTQQVRVNWKLAECIRLCLFPYLSGCIDQRGDVVWSQLAPTGYSLLAGDWAKDYSGTRCTFQLMQLPGA